MKCDVNDVFSIFSSENVFAKKDQFQNQILT